jgi:hypothetical protein
MMLGSNLQPGIDCPDLDISWSISVPPDKFWDSTSIGPRSILLKSFRIHHSSIRVRVRVRVTLRLAVYRQSVRLGATPSRHTTRVFFFATERLQS